MGLSDCRVAEVRTSGRIDTSTLEICPHAPMLAMWTCRLKNRLQGEGEDAMVVSRGSSATRCHQSAGRMPLARAAHSDLKSSGDCTRRQGDKRLLWISKKQVHKWLYTFRNWHKAPAPWSAHWHCVPSPKQGLLASNLARHCQHYAKSKPPHHGSDHRE